MRVSEQLPGVYFRTASRPVENVLPRMDVAVFVGFASAGPLNVPVPVEDAAQFHQVFGPDLPLAWDPVREETGYAHLAGTVRAFFRNGGRRCWIVRVAGPGAVVNTFPLPGLFVVTDDSRLTPARVSARSPGSWSDDIEVSASLVSELLPLRQLRVDDKTIQFAAGGPTNISTGDLIRVTFENNLQLLFPIPEGHAVDPVGKVTATSERCVWLGNSVDGVPVIVSRPEWPERTLRAERLTFDLWVRRFAETGRRLAGLGFSDQHAAYWGSLPHDDELFGTAPPVQRATLWERVANPRWPLAGGSSGWSIPVAMPFHPQLWRSGRDQRSAVETALERDGLGDFGANLFLGDETGVLRALVEPTAERLLSNAEFYRWGGVTERALPGIFAALGIEEATLLAVPDAVHRGWHRSPSPSPPPLPSPLPEVLPARPCSTWDFIPCDESPPTVGERLVDRQPRRPDARPPWESNPENEYQPDTLLAVQRAMIRISAARGDMLAVLSLPEHFRDTEAVSYVNRLSSSNGPNIKIRGTSILGPSEILSVPLRGQETTALSYGAVYHPWLFSRASDDGVVRGLPPDGAACGVAAKRAINRGSWIAPANERLEGVHGLTPAIDATQSLALQSAHVNLIRPEARGFLTLTADTLSPDPELRPINVRRLLSLLRRQTLQLGAEYTFEPNDNVFRRAVQRGFERTMEYLFDRGAFAGRTHSDSFRVVVDTSVNSAARLEQGQFVVELRVAPSLPLTFLTVRLLQDVEHGGRVGGS